MNNNLPWDIIIAKFERFIRLLIVSVIVSPNKVLLRILSKRK